MKVVFAILTHVEYICVTDPVRVGFYFYYSCKLDAAASNFFYICRLWCYSYNTWALCLILNLADFRFY